MITPLIYKEKFSSSMRLELFVRHRSWMHRQTDSLSLSLLAVHSLIFAVSVCGLDCHTRNPSSACLRIKYCIKMIAHSMCDGRRRRCDTKMLLERTFWCDVGVSFPSVFREKKNPQVRPTLSVIAASNLAFNAFLITLDVQSDNGMTRWKKAPI